MELIPCRDCGQMISLHGRGCSQCARNLEAERVWERILTLAFIVVVAIVCGLVGFLIYRMF